MHEPSSTTSSPMPRRARSAPARNEVVLRGRVAAPPTSASCPAATRSSPPA